MYLSESKFVIEFNKNDLSGSTFTAISKYFSKNGANRAMVEAVVDRLIKSGKLVRRDGRFYLKNSPEIAKKPKEKATLTGVFRAVERGFGFVTADGEDYFIRAEDMGQALDGDTVAIRRKDGGRENDLAEITDVIKRGIIKTVGTVFVEGGLSYVRPDDRAYFADIFVKDPAGASVGDKVYVEIKRFPKNRCPEGVVLAVIGRQFDFETELKSIIYASGVETDFDQAAASEAQAVPDKVGISDIVGRVDLRDKQIFTVDGESARDFDDAVSLEIVDGKYRLGVHIADVSNYVVKNSALDKCASARGTSVYLPDEVVPMLPTRLSNGICSLNEGVDRLTVTVDMTFDDGGNLIKSEIYESVIKSTHRLTYTLVQGIIDGEAAALEAHPDVNQTILEMNALRLLIENRRKKAGYIDLDVKESDVSTENGEIKIGLHKSNDATKLIEQFMITANEVVANYLFNRHLPCVYRVHEPPLAEKARSLFNFLKALGINADLGGSLTPKKLQKILCDNGDSRLAPVINRMVLRSMQKAKYSSENSGHFGLASECYCHFTSPIRRYPDLAVHRVLKDALSGKDRQLIDLYEGFLKEVSENCSLTERRADELERTVDDLYKTRFMAGRIGEEFFGVISGVTQNGFFVELENTCEGFVPIETLPAGTYCFDKENLTLSTHRRTYKLGDRVKICVIAADILTRRVDFCIAK